MKDGQGGNTEPVSGERLSRGPHASAGDRDSLQVTRVRGPMLCPGRARESVELGRFVLQRSGQARYLPCVTRRRSEAGQRRASV